MVRDTAIQPELDGNHPIMLPRFFMKSESAGGAASRSLFRQRRSSEAASHFEQGECRATFAVSALAVRGALAAQERLPASSFFEGSFASPIEPAQASAANEPNPNCAAKNAR